MSHLCVESAVVSNGAVLGNGAQGPSSGVLGHLVPRIGSHYRQKTEHSVLDGLEPHSAVSFRVIDNFISFQCDSDSRAAWNKF